MRYILIPILLFTTFITSCKKETILSNKMEETIYVRNGGADMPAFVRGNGNSKVFILILHGGPGGNGSDYQYGDYATQLEEKYAMVYWDQRHQGNSHGHFKDEDVTIEAMVEDTYVVLKTLRARYGDDISLFLMGHSWGGLLGTAFMTTKEYQHELNGWIEVAGAHDIPLLNTSLINMIDTIGAQEIASGNHVEKWNEIIDYSKTLDPATMSTSQTLKLNNYAHSTEALLSQITPEDPKDITPFEYLFFSPSNILTTLQSGSKLPDTFKDQVFSSSYTEQLSKIVIPTMLQYGKYDLIVPAALGISAYEKISSTHKSLKIYQNSGHSPMRNEGTLFTSDVIEFIETYK